MTTNFHCTCSKLIPEALVIRLLKESLRLKCSGCGEVWTRDRLLDEGIRCPCCAQFAKRYKRKLNVGIARWLIALERLHRTGLEWVHIAWIAAVVGGEQPAVARKLPIGASPIGSGDYAKARYWKLIEDRPSDDSAKKDSGFWRITEKGRAFVVGGLRVPERVILYNNELQGFDGSPITIQEALGQKFDYSELMEASA